MATEHDYQAFLDRVAALEETVPPTVVAARHGSAAG